MKRHLGFLWRGLAMGAADIVPGVSGGTVAFITGIYDRLISAIKDGIDRALDVARHRSLKPIKRIDWEFIIPLGIGIVAAFGAGSLFIPHLIQAYPAMVYAFFVGLIIASALVVFRKVTSHRYTGFLWAGLGILAGYLVSSLGASPQEPAAASIALMGLAASSAMLLPGISGSLILLLLGGYEFMLESIASLDLMVMALFATGAIIGLGLLSHLLGWLLKKYPDQTHYWLAGLMIGALKRPMQTVLENTAGTATISLFLMAGVGMIAVLALERYGSATPGAQ